RRSFYASSSYHSDPVSLSPLISYDHGASRLSSQPHHYTPYYSNGSSSLSRCSSSLDAWSRTYPGRSEDVRDTMSRYTSSRYDSSSYKTFDPSTTGAYRSSNLTGYSSYGSGSRSADRLGSYSSNGVSSSSSGTALGSSGLGSYSSRSRHSDVSLPRSTSFGRSEVLSSSTPRSESDTTKTGYSSSLSRSSSLPSHSQEPRSSSYRHSTRSSTFTSDTTSDKDAAASERQLRLSQRRRQREEQAAYSETSSDNSKEPSVERASSLRRDSDSDSIGAYSGVYTRRRLRDKNAELGIQASSVAEEQEEKDGSGDVVQSAFRRPRRWRDGSWSSEDSTQAAASGATDAADATSGSARRRRVLEGGVSQTSADSETAGSAGVPVLDSGVESLSAERRRRRQQRLEATKQARGIQDEDVGRSEESSAGATRSWRQRLHDSGVSGVKQGDGESETTGSRRRSYDGESETSSRRRSQDGESESVGRRRSFRGIGDSASSRDGTPDAADLTTRRVSLEAEVETRAERIARYKEERRKQLAHIANITSGSGSEEKEVEALPSLFTAAKREKEEAAADVDKQSQSKTDGSAGGLTLTHRLRSLRGSDEDKLTTVTETSDREEKDDKPPAQSVDSKVISKDSGIKTPDTGKTDSSAPSATSSGKAGTPTTPSQTSARGRGSSSSEPPGRQKSPSPFTARKLPSAQEPVSARTSSASASDRSSRKASSSSSEQSSTRKPSESSSERRTHKSPSPASSRLMAATKSSAAKETHSAPRPSRGSASPKSSPSPRGSLSPRGSPAPADSLRSVRSSVTSTAATKGQPAIKQTLMPERGTKDAGTHVAAASSEEKKEESNRGSKSTDRDSGFGSSRLSSSSFSSARSPDKETVVKPHAPPSKTGRLQRTPHVEVSSSSSREGSEEKQVIVAGRIGQAGKTIGSVKRTSSLPSRKVADIAASGDRSAAPGAGLRERSSSQRTERTSSSSSQEGVVLHRHIGDGSPPARRTRASSSSQDGKVSNNFAGSTGVSKTVPDAGRKGLETNEKSKTDVAKPIEIATPVGPSSQMSPPALDDLLAKNAEYLSSDEESSSSPMDSPRATERRKLKTGEESSSSPMDSPRATERRKLKTGEEPRLRRSLRRKL
ncbi:hypothetical protein BaRGS_00007297, partial [Batillaria attramentaria]